MAPPPVLAGDRPVAETIPLALRVPLGIAGLAGLAYFGGGLVVTLLAGRRDPTLVFLMGGALAGLALLCTGLLGGHPRARPIARGGLVGALVGGGLAIVPGIPLLGLVLGGQAPVVWAALVLVPAGTLIGGGTGAARVARRTRPPRLAAGRSIRDSG